MQLNHYEYQLSIFIYRFMTHKQLNDGFVVVVVVVVKARMEVEDLFVDLADGKKLLKLLEIISGEKLSKPNNGRMRVHKIENVNKSLAFLHTKVHSWKKSSAIRPSIPSYIDRVSLKPSTCCQYPITISSFKTAVAVKGKWLDWWQSWNEFLSHFSNKFATN